MRCKVCGEEALIPLWSDGKAQWHRCLGCGSDSASRSYRDTHHLYGPQYIQDAIDRDGPIGNRTHNMQTNFDLFKANRAGCPNNSFLDIGCCDGAGLAGMQERGWAVHGFDIVKPPYFGPHVTVSPSLHAGLFPQQFAAVMAREVIEHVENWRTLLLECWNVTASGGLFQVQTPRPWTEPHTIHYQEAHLQLFAPFVLRTWLERLGFAVIEQRLYDMGQCVICRK